MKPPAEFFDQYEREYSECFAVFSDAARDLPNKEDVARQAKDMVAMVEATVVANGGVGEYQLSGANEKARAASLAVVLEQYPTYLDAREQHREAELVVARLKAQRDEALEGMRMCRTFIEYGRELLAMRAAQLNTQARK